MTAPPCLRSIHTGESLPSERDEELSPETKIAEKAPYSEIRLKSSDRDNSRSFLCTSSEEESLDEEKNKALPSPFFLAATIPFRSFTSSPPCSIPTSVGNIPEVCLTFFDRVCGEILITDAAGYQKTSIVLPKEGGPDSLFAGAIVTIEEYSTAPKIFNVSIIAGEEGIGLLQTHMAGFFQLLETRNFSFGIHKIDTYISTDPRPFAREESGGQDQEDKEDL